MSEEKKQKGLFKSLAELSFVKKLKSIKHIEIIIVVIFVLILLLICFSGNSLFGFSNSASTETADNSTVSYTTTSQYIENMESKLKNLISNVKDAGNVEVMIMCDGVVSKTYATDETITTSGQTTEKQNNIILVEVDGKKEPIIIGETLPKITGVVVVSSGASNTKVKLDILSVVQTLFNLESSKIQILNGN